MYSVYKNLQIWAVIPVVLILFYLFIYLFNFDLS